MESCIQTHTQASAHAHAQTTHACAHELHKYTCVLKVSTHIHFILVCVSSSLNIMLPFPCCSDLWEMVVCSYDNKVSII